jgi:hypothetical protein
MREPIRPNRREYDMRFLGAHEQLLSMVHEPAQRSSHPSDPIQRMQEERARNREMAGQRILRSQYVPRLSSFFFCFFFNLQITNRVVICFYLFVTSFYFLMFF